jgi:hypothetical protein
MKEKAIFFGVVLLFLLGYGVMITVRVVSVEKRLNRLESSHQMLESECRVLSNTLAHVRMTPELVSSLSAAIAQEGRRLPAVTNRDLRLIGSDFNSPPGSVPSR